jgi:hypothetical protein
VGFAGKEKAMRKAAIGLAVFVAFSLAVALHAQTVVPAGTSIYVTLNQSVSSKDAQVGQTVDGSLASNVVVNGRTVIPRDSRVTLVVASARPSGRLKTPAKLYLRVRSVEVNGRSYAVSSDLAGQTGPSHKKRNIIGIGGGTAAGAVIGGIVGGGKGAAIGAGAGAGAGTAGTALTGKKDVNYPAETKLRFRLRAPLRIG